DGGPATTGRTTRCAASGSAAPHPRPPWSSADPDTRCAAWCGSRSVDAVRRRSAPSPPRPPTPAAPPPTTDGQHRRHRPPSTHPTTRAGQTDPGPSCASPSRRLWSVSQRLTRWPLRHAGAALLTPLEGTRPARDAWRDAKRAYDDEAAPYVGVAWLPTVPRPDAVEGLTREGCERLTQLREAEQAA